MAIHRRRRPALLRPMGASEIRQEQGGRILSPHPRKGLRKVSWLFEAIVGGNVAIGLAEPHQGSRIESNWGNNDVSSGALFRAIKSLYEEGHLLGAGSPSGSDTDVSSLGIVQGHAYAICRCEKKVMPMVRIS